MPYFEHNPDLSSARRRDFAKAMLVLSTPAILLTGLLFDAGTHAAIPFPIWELLLLSFAPLILSAVASLYYAMMVNPMGVDAYGYREPVRDRQPFPCQEHHD
jgi:hypothetical protein